MKTVFADTFYFIALFNRADDGHRPAVEFTAAYMGEILTTTFVLTELGDAMNSARNRQKFTDTLRDLHANPQVHIVHPDEQLFQAGCDLFAQRPDKEWSLTDCISFVVMQRRGIVEGLTADHHFEQAGFIALLKA